MKKFIKIIVLIVITIPFTGSLVTSCSEEENCAIGRPMLWTTFYKPRELASDEWVGYKIDSLTVSIINPETNDTIVNQQREVEYISLPLQYTAESSGIVLHFSQTLRDTIIFKHTNTPYFVSMECGTEMRQEVIEIDYTTHKIDSISVRNKETSRNAKDNLRFYIQPDN